LVTLLAHDRRGGALVAIATATVGMVSGGPVAGVVVAAYAVIGWRALGRHRRARAAVAREAAALDAVAVLAADLRAGSTPDTALRAALPALVARHGNGPSRTPDLEPLEPGTSLARAADLPVARRVLVSWRLADSTGAPLADVLDRLDIDLRAGARAVTAAAAQAAGAKATALLLAGLPVAGIAVGYALGVDPLAILLRTPLGASCALGALTLQLAGLAWSGRLSRLPGEDLAGSGGAP